MTSPDDSAYEVDRAEYHELFDQLFKGQERLQVEHRKTKHDLTTRLDQAETSRKSETAVILERLDQMDHTSQIAAALAQQRARIWGTIWLGILGSATILTGAYTVLYALGLHH